MKYSRNILIERLKDVSSEMTFLNDMEFEFDDISVFVNGFIQETYDYDPGDYFTPPSMDLIDRYVELHSVTSYGEDYEIHWSTEDIIKLEKQVSVID